jgi:hypothetical protein
MDGQLIRELLQYGALGLLCAMEAVAIVVLWRRYVQSEDEYRRSVEAMIDAVRMACDNIEMIKDIVNQQRHTNDIKSAVGQVFEEKLRPSRLPAGWQEETKDDPAQDNAGSAAQRRPRL